MEMNRLEKNYKVKERAENAVIKHLSIDKAIEFLTKELEEFESLWGRYSSDCLGHGIQCNRLLISWLERTK